MNKAAESSKPKVIAGMSAYNEEKYIGTMVLSARRFVDEVIVVDDGSADNTAEIARLAGATVIRHEKNLGKGASVQNLLDEAKKKKPDVLVLIDADAQHDPGEIPQLVKPIHNGFDLVIGSRKAEDSKTPAYRRIGQKILLFSTRVLSGAKVTDSESGFRALSGKAIAEISLTENGFAVETEMIARAAANGLKITEVPVSNIYTKDGSTLNPMVHGFGVLGRIITMISEQKPLFFFGLSGAILIVLGIIAGVRVLELYVASKVLPIGTTMVAVLFLVIGVFSIFTGLILRALARRRNNRG
jgi:glycosyltransferase involved in cell wall biosynthesis